MHAVGEVDKVVAMAFVAVADKALRQRWHGAEQLADELLCKAARMVGAPSAAELLRSIGILNG